MGFTLLELLLVLAILTTVLAMGLPALQQMQSRAQFKATVLQIQSELYQARLTAMKSGAALVFCFREGTGSYELMPKEVYDRRLRSQQRADSMVGSLQLASEPAAPLDTQDDRARIDKRQLPPEIIFQGEPASRTIMFYPNGRTSQALFSLVSTGEDHWYGEIMVRGITGVPRVNRIGVRVEPETAPKEAGP